MLTKHARNLHYIVIMDVHLGYIDTENDVGGNRRFIMMSFRRHICPPKSPVPQLSRNGQYSVLYVLFGQCMPIIFKTDRPFSVILSSHIGNLSEFASVMTNGPM